MKPSLFERYRPQTWADVVGQDKAIEAIQTVGAHKGFGGSIFWISGQSSSGKSTLARLIAKEIADDFWIDVMDASELTGERLNDIERSWCMYGGGRGGKALIIEEAHGLSARAARRLNVMLENSLPNHVVVVFTTTIVGQDRLFEGVDDATPLVSRCHQIALAQRDLATPFAERVRMIAQAEGLDGQPLERYVRLLKDCRNNIRMALNAVETGAMKSA